MIRATALLAVIGAFGAGCSCGTSIGEDLRFACFGDTSCGDGYRCHQDTCLPEDDPVFRICVVELCGDGVDNDCDGKVDCDDEDCCVTCGTCETQCGDGVDNDGDGLADCADSDCDEQVCGTHGRVCAQGACTCPAGQSPESSCTDGQDNNCDGLVDCADPDCDAEACGANGRVCTANACACPGGGTTETTCSDGLDDDCDGLVDCADPDCLLQPCSATAAAAVCCATSAAPSACADVDVSDVHCGTCGVACTNGRTCAVGTCTCPTGQTVETACADGTDDDCDGLVDCADPDCLTRPCSATVATAVCCATSTAASACADLASNKSHCGGCGIACGGNRDCVAVLTGGGEPAGACACTQQNHCRTGAVCLGGTHCACTAGGSQCAAGQQCSGDVTTPGYCIYP